ncbi:hypothetical protein KKG71_03500, partial [Patescibacteria group bacterium]|nr:hypothetical protein [Patescibacteria group bacterium]
MGADTHRTDNIQDQNPLSEYPDFDSLGERGIREGELTKRQAATLKAVQANMAHDSESRKGENKDIDGISAMEIYENQKFTIEGSDKDK